MCQTLELDFTGCILLIIATSMGHHCHFTGRETEGGQRTCLGSLSKTLKNHFAFPLADLQ